MTPESGIEHSEMHSQESTLEMLQIWVNLPSQNKMTTPGYQAITSQTIPKVTLEAGNGTASVIARKGVNGPASSFTPIDLLNVELEGDTSTIFQPKEGWVGAVMVRRGSIDINGATVSCVPLVRGRGPKYSSRPNQKEQALF